MSEDAVALTDLAFRSKAHWGYDAGFMAACRGELTVPPAYLNTELSGIFQDGLAIYGFYLLTRTSETGLAELTFFFVDPEQIGTGVGA
ncbi:MAG TPA: hypothetical protein EYQ81_02945 [Sneathiellales bacterium]|jgi:hypothetical protein|nr:hypothetical protein [Sneathiellales bacterium]